MEEKETSISPLTIFVNLTSEGLLSLVAIFDQLSLVSWEKCRSAEVVQLNTGRSFKFPMFVV